MISATYALFENPADGVQVGVAIAFEDGAVFVRRWDTDSPRLYESLDEAMAEHSDCEARQMPATAPTTPSAEEVRADIEKVCAMLAKMLVEKNQAYGNSVLDPVRLFSKVTAIEGAFVRVDDKLSRLARGHEYPGDDTLRDLIGYLILILVGKRLGVE
jgi:hypothetical protein